MTTKVKNEVEHDVLHDLVERLRRVGQDAGDRLSELLAEASVRERVDAIADRIDDLTLELARHLPHSEAPRSLEDMTVEELHELASERDIKGRSGMHKAELIEALRKG